MSEIMKELSVYPVILEQTVIVVFLLEFLSHRHRNLNQDRKAIHVAWLKLFSRNLVRPHIRCRTGETHLFFISTP